MHELVAANTIQPSPVDRCWLCCCIPLDKGFVTWVDPLDWLSFRKWNWKAKKGRGGYYAFAKVGTSHGVRNVYLHRLIMNTPRGLQVHHKNRFTLDNRRVNLENLSVSDHEAITHRFRISRLTIPR